MTCASTGDARESQNHPTACYHVNTGNRFGGDPAVGAWVTYGLGTLNEPAGLCGSPADQLPARWRQQLVQRLIAR